MRVLLVSKPIVPPFHDGSKSLVTALCASMERGVDLRVLGARAHPVAGATVVPLYPDPKNSGSRFAPSLFDNAKALAYLAVEQEAQIWHFVFAPNLRAAAAVQAVRRLRSKPTLQTIASPPRDFAQVDKLLFGDVVVAQSEWTRKQILAYRQREVEVIPPPFSAPERPSLAEQAEVRRRLGLTAEQKLIVFPGDLEFGGGAERSVELARHLPKEMNDTQVVLACRHKTAKAKTIEAKLRASCAGLPVTFAGELPSLLPLLATAEAVIFPVTELFGKVDIPIALLEAAAFGAPVLVADEGPVSELQGAVKLPHGDTGRWLQELGRLRAEDSYRAQVSQDAQRGILQRHGVERVASRYAELYRQLARQGTHR